MRGLGSRRTWLLARVAVYVTIILVLFALTVTATVAIMQKSEVRETENTIRLLDMAYQEWKLDADRALSWGVADQPYTDATYDRLNDTPHVYTVSEVLRRVRRSPKAKAVLAQIDPKFAWIYEDLPDDERPSWLRLTSPDDPDPNRAMSNDDAVYAGFVGEMAVLDQAGEEGWCMIDHLATGVVLESTGGRWLHRRDEGGKAGPQVAAAQAEGWSHIGDWYNISYYCRRA